MFDDHDDNESGWMTPDKAPMLPGSARDNAQKAEQAERKAETIASTREERIESGTTDPAVSRVATGSTAAAGENSTTAVRSSWPVSSGRFWSDAPMDAATDGTMTNEIGQLGALLGDSLASGRSLALSSGRDALLVVGLATLEAMAADKLLTMSGIKNPIARGLLAVGILLTTTTIASYLITREKGDNPLVRV